MAVLNKIRQRSFFLILVIALALFAFILTDLFKNSDALTSKGQDSIATINGKDINRIDFMNKVESIQRQMGPSASRTQALNRVWDQELKSAVLESQFEELGISVQKDQMRDMLKTNLATLPDFQNEAGLFDESKLDEFIANLKDIAPERGLLGGQPIDYESWVNYENTIAASAVEQSYYNMVKAGVVATVKEGEMEHMLESENLDIKYVQIPFSSIPDSTITVSKSDISNYINNNKKRFEVEESRNIAYVQFKEEASLEDEEAIKENLKKTLNNRLEYNEITKTNDTVIGFNNATDYSDFVSANSALPYVDKYLFKSELPSTSSENLSNLKLGETYGPYKEGGYIKLSKLVAETRLPDSVKVRHILIPFAGASRVDPSVTKTDEQAKKTADSILAVVKRNRSKFKSLLELSSDKVSNEKDGEIEFAYGAPMAEEFKKFSFENNKGDVDVVKTSFGYHIIEILSQGDKQRAVKIATLAEEIEPSQVTIDNTFTKAQKFEIAASKTKFQDAAKENNYDLRPVSTIKELDENIPGIGNQRDIVRWAFEEDSNIGDIKRFDLNGVYVVVQLRQKNEAGIMSTEDASVTATPDIRKEKKAKIIMDRISASTLDDIASAEGQTIKVASAINMKNPTISGAGREPKIVGTAFGLAEGATSSLIEGNNGVYVVQVTKKSPAVTLDSYQAKANQISVQRNNSITSKLFNALKEAADIDDNRAVVY